MIVTPYYKFKWKSDLKVEYLERLQEDECREHLNVFNECVANNIDIAVEAIGNITAYSAKNMKVQVRKYDIKNMQPSWWDKECERAKGEKYAKLKNYRITRRGVDRDIYIQARKRYKDMCRSKQEVDKASNRHKLILVKDNPNEFWKHIMYLTKTPASNKGKLNVEIFQCQQHLNFLIKWSSLFYVMGWKYGVGNIQRRLKKCSICIL